MSRRLLSLLVLVLLVAAVFAQTPLSAFFDEKTAKLKALAQAVQTRYMARASLNCNCSHYDCKLAYKDLDTCSTRHGSSFCNTPGRCVPLLHEHNGPSAPAWPRPLLHRPLIFSSHEFFM